MTSTTRSSVVLALAMLTCIQSARARPALGTEITYSRSNMRIGGSLLNGEFDFQFKVFDAQAGGNLVAPAITRNGIAVNNGVLKSQLLDFGDGAFNGEARFIDVKARPNGGGGNGFLAVGPRQEFHPVAYALALPGLRTIQNDDSPNIVGGFAGNTVAGNVVGVTISGGGILGNPNSADAHFSTVGGGVGNSTAGNSSTVGGGNGNHANGESATVAGGTGNVASGEEATVGGGINNTASGRAATIPGGGLNLAEGVNSFAAGHRAKADADGTFVWGDSTEADIFSGGTDTFNVRASGGTAFYSNSALTAGVLLAPGGGSWAAFSDRASKSNIQPVNPRIALQKVIQLPISTWNYNAQDESIRHIGPMAQDFHAAFAVGEDDRHITTIDADGVLFAAVQGLHQMLVERDVRIAEQRAEIDELNQRLARLEQAPQAPQNH